MMNSIRPKRQRDQTFVPVRSPTEAGRALYQMVDIATRHKGYATTSLIILCPREVLHMLLDHNDFRYEYSSNRTILGCDVCQLDDREEGRYSLGLTVSLGSAFAEDVPFEDTPRTKYRTECVPIWMDVSDDPRERGKRYFK